MGKKFILTKSKISVWLKQINHEPKRIVPACTRPQILAGRFQASGDSGQPCRPGTGSSPWPGTQPHLTAFQPNTAAKPLPFAAGACPALFERNSMTTMTAVHLPPMAHISTSLSFLGFTNSFVRASECSHCPRALKDTTDLMQFLST